MTRDKNKRTFQKDLQVDMGVRHAQSKKKERKKREGSG
jgi:hypothetical protein